jgi:hypothetical protein
MVEQVGRAVPPERPHRVLGVVGCLPAGNARDAHAVAVVGVDERVGDALRPHQPACRVVWVCKGAAIGQVATVISSIRLFVHACQAAGHVGARAKLLIVVHVGVAAIDPVPEAPLLARRHQHPIAALDRGSALLVDLDAQPVRTVVDHDLDYVPRVQLDQVVRVAPTAVLFSRANQSAKASSAGRMALPGRKDKEDGSSLPSLSSLRISLWG